MARVNAVILSAVMVLSMVAVPTGVAASGASDAPTQQMGVADEAPSGGTATARSARAGSHGSSPSGVETVATLARMASTTENSTEQEDRDIGETEPDRTVSAGNTSELTYEIPLPSEGVFTPDEGLDPVLTDTTSNEVYALVQLAAEPTDDEAALLEEHGYERVMGVTETTSYGRLPTGSLESVADMEVVRAVTAIEPEWRVDPEFAALVEERGEVEATVLTFEPLSAETVESLGLQRVGGDENLTTGETLTYYGVLDSGALGQLQDNQRVYWMDEAAQGEPLLAQGRRMVGAPMAANALSGTDYTGQGVKVGVLDTGIAHNHRHFSDTRIVDAKDWGDGDTYPEAPAGCPHGVHVAGTVAGSGSVTWYDWVVDRNVTTEVTGVAPNATLVASRVFERSGSNDCDWATADVGPQRKFNKVRDKGAKILTNSWGVTAHDDGDYDIPASKTDTWVRKHRDSVVVFANGNNDSDVSGQHDASPALAKNVISVGAVRDGSLPNGAGNVTDTWRFRTNTDSQTLNSVDPLKDYADCGSFRRKPEVYAPGDYTTAPVTNGEYGTKLGTSMAAPHVAGVAALFREKYPDTTAAEVRAHLVSTATPPNLEGYGVVNANNALFTNPYESVHKSFDGDLKKGKSDEKDFDVPADAEKVVVTLVWTDPGHTPSAGAGVNCDGKGSGILANDLDLRAGPSDDPMRHEKLHDSNVKRIVVEDPESGTWTANVTAHRVTFLTKQNYEVVYRVVTDEPTLDVAVPDQVVVPPSPDNETVGFAIEGTGAPVAGIHGDLDPGRDVGLCNKSGEFVAGTLSDGHNFTLERCLNVPDQAGTYEVELTINTTNAATVTGGDGSPRPRNVTKTVEIVVPGPTIHVEPYVRNATIGEVVSYRVVASNVSRGVDDFGFEATMLDTNVGRFVGGSVGPSADDTFVDTVTYGESIVVRGDGLDTGAYGNVTLATIRAEGQSIGTSGIDFEFTEFRDTEFVLEDTTYEDASKVWKAVLNVPAGESDLSVDISTDRDSETSIAGGVGVLGQQIGFEINDSDLAADVEIEAVQWDLGDGTSLSGVETEHSYDEPGSYEVSAEVLLSDGRVVNTRRIVVIRTVAVGVDAGDTVAPGEETNITVFGFNSGDLRLREVPANWTVTATDPSGLTTVPSPEELPYETRTDDVLGHVYGSVGYPTFELTVRAPNETGNYTMTAEASRQNETARYPFTVAVRNQTEHESGVSAETFETVAGSDGLGRQDLLGMVRNYIRDEPLGDIRVSRSEVLKLVRYYILRSSL